MRIFENIEISVNADGVYAVFDDIDIHIETTDKEAALTVYRALYTLQCVETALMDGVGEPKMMMIVYRSLRNEDITVMRDEPDEDYYAGYLMPNMRNRDEGDE